MNAGQSDAFRELMNKERAIALQFREQWAFKKHLESLGWDPNSYDPATGTCSRPLPRQNRAARPASRNYHSLIPAPYEDQEYREVGRYNRPAAGQAGTPKVPSRYPVVSPKRYVYQPRQSRYRSGSRPVTAHRQSRPVSRSQQRPRTSNTRGANSGRPGAYRRMCEITRWKEALLLSKTRI